MPLVSALHNKDPFKKVHIDCTEPWTVWVKSDVTVELSQFKLHILTMVDAATNWLELATIPTANSRSCTKHVDLCWLCHYSCSNTVGPDNGNEFMGEEFQELLTCYNIESKPITVKT